MTTWQATATFSGTSTFRVIARGKWYAQASFAGASTFRLIGRGKWYAEARFSGVSTFNARMKGPQRASAFFQGVSHFRATMRGPWRAVASFQGVSHFRIIPSQIGQDFLNMPAATVDIETFTDADYAVTYQWVPGDIPFDFTDHQLTMMVRKIAEDDEVFLAIESSTGGIPANQSGIDIYESFSPGPDDRFDIIISRADLSSIPPGDYVQSLILIRPDGLRYDIWRGAFTLAIGPTR